MTQDFLCTNNKCAIEKNVVLSNGSNCCNFCEQYRLECEARYVLSLQKNNKRNDRARWLRVVAEFRGEQASNALAGRVIYIHQKRKS